MTGGPLDTEALSCDSHTVEIPNERRKARYVDVPGDSAGVAG
jgi:hypothetical protein